MSGVMVREATVGDAEAVELVHVRAWQAGYAGILSDDLLAALDLVERAESRRAYLTDPNRAGTVFVAALDGVVVGFADVGPYRIDQGGSRLDLDVGEVYSLYVHPERWGAGAGRALMDAALAHLSGPRPRPVLVWILAANTAARRFYERCGFVADDTLAVFTMRTPDGAEVDLDAVRYMRAASAT